MYNKDNQLQTHIQYHNVVNDPDKQVIGGELRYMNTT
jgi:hypothetical protein